MLIFEVDDDDLRRGGGDREDRRVRGEGATPITWQEERTYFRKFR